ncbi:MAG TPA: cupin domain-containing protein [Candidatus Binatia bacterium]|nr:cupin domain-containing protein [Candidatus Binatia bacterium]
MNTAKLDAELQRKNLAGYWSVRARDYQADQPFLWKWADLYEGLMQATEQVGFEYSERRSIRLVNPNVPGNSTSRNLQFSFSIVNPGEIARAHRHNLAAIRFVVQGDNAYTVVEGERFPMEPGDLILTPNWTWHDHVNKSDKPIIWLDGLDAPLIQAQNILFYEQYEQEVQKPTREEVDSARRFGFARRTSRSGGEQRGVPFRYDWKSTYESLRCMPEADVDPFDGHHLRYVNPLTGGYTLPTMSCEVQLLSCGMMTQMHRHASSVLCFVFKGSGRTKIGEGHLNWQKGDCFVIPHWQWHAHENTSSDEAVLFSINDRPIIEVLQLYREEVWT